MRVELKARNQLFRFEAALGEPILYAGLRYGLDLPYECATGTCGTCKAELTDGRLRDLWAEAPGRNKLGRSNGEFLLCQCVAETNVAVEVRNFVAGPPSLGVNLPRAYRGILRTSELLARDVMSFSVALNRACDFEAGQFMTVRAEGPSGYYSYSIANSLNKSSTLDFVVERKPGDGFSEWLFGAPRDGSMLGLFGPLGRATYYPRLPRNILCIASGTGVARMMSILSRAVSEGGLQNQLAWLFFGVRSRQDMFYLRELTDLCVRSSSRLKVTVALSEQAVSDELKRQWPALSFQQGVVHEIAKRAMAGNYQNVRAYVAGPPPVITAALQVLLEAKLSVVDIRYDKFTS